MDLMNIYFLVQEFYAIEAVSALLQTDKYICFEPMRHSHSRWHRDFTDFRDDYITRFAAAIFDYTVMVVAAELRHCGEKATMYINGYYNSDLSRNQVYAECSVYDAHDILTAGLRLFDSCWVDWKRSFGGKKWWQIAKAGTLKGVVCDCTFIDHCVDLSHNNSVYFDKNAGLFRLDNSNAYKEFLDLKRDCAPRQLLAEPRGRDFNRLLRRANTLGIIWTQPVPDGQAAARDESESLLLRYKPMTWGKKRLDYSDGNLCDNIWFGRSYRRSCNDRRERLGNGGRHEKTAA
jgi:hypothetical protein